MVPNMTFGNSRPPSVSLGSGNRKCTYCYVTNHIRETCFKLNEYLEWFVQKKGTQTKGNNSRPQAHHISTGSQASILSQVDQSSQQVFLANAST